MIGKECRKSGWRRLGRNHAGHNPPRKLETSWRGDPFFSNPLNTTSDRLQSIPVVHALQRSGLGDDAAHWFAALAGLPGRIWLDSAIVAAGGKWGVDPSVRRGTPDALARLSRYSFLSADPVCRLVADPTDPEPWPQLKSWADRLPNTTDPTLPPFQGGLAGLIGYEAGRWLETDALGAVHQHQRVDLPTPAIDVGVYDWVIAIDHWTGKAWLISQGFQADDIQGSESEKWDGGGALRLERARQRADAVLHRVQSYQRLSAFVAGQRTPAVLPGDRDQPAAPVSNFTGPGFRDAVREVVRRICAGDSFQVNLAQRLTLPMPADAQEIYLALRQSNPAPFAAFYDGDHYQVLSSSPEGFLQLRGGTVETRPIKGTVARTGNALTDQELASELLSSVKDRAENIMIVDLMRNDLSRVCEDESVEVTQLCQVEKYQCVQHLVSAVCGRLKSGVAAVDLLQACFPGGSVTGAPKIEAMRTIAELEPHPRGAYCGSIGYLSCGGNADFNILIRTMTATKGMLQIPVGGGITAKSDPVAEEQETWIKAQGMLNAFASGAEQTDSPPAAVEPPAPTIWDGLKLGAVN